MSLRDVSESNLARAAMMMITHPSLLPSAYGRWTISKIPGRGEMPIWGEVRFDSNLSLHWLSCHSAGLKVGNSMQCDMSVLSKFFCAFDIKIEKLHIRNLPRCTEGVRRKLSSWYLQEIHTTDSNFDRQNGSRIDHQTLEFWIYMSRRAHAQQSDKAYVWIKHAPISYSVQLDPGKKGSN